MSNQLSVPVTFDDAIVNRPSDRADEVVPKARAEIAEIAATGVTVTSVHVVNLDAPYRYYVKFPMDEPQWRVRAKLEQKLYDVGQKLEKNALAFYVSKRITKTGGWSV